MEREETSEREMGDLETKARPAHPIHFKDGSITYTHCPSPRTGSTVGGGFCAVCKDCPCVIQMPISELSEI